MITLVDKGVKAHILDKKEKAFLIPMAPRIPTMYYLPKNTKMLTIPPGRPIVSGINSITARIGKYIDFYLQPIVKKVPSYLKDTNDTI